MRNILQTLTLESQNRKLYGTNTDGQQWNATPQSQNVNTGGCRASLPQVVNMLNDMGYPADEDTIKDFGTTPSKYITVPQIPADEIDNVVKGLLKKSQRITNQVIIDEYPIASFFALAERIEQWIKISSSSTEADLDRRIQERNNAEQISRVQALTLQSLETNPDDAAKVQGIAQRAGLPTELVVGREKQVESVTRNLKTSTSAIWRR